MAKNKDVKIIDAWVGYTNGKPHKYTNDNGEKEWCVFRNRTDARKAFEDVRRVSLVIYESRR